MLKYVCILSAALLLGLCSCTVYDRGTGNYLDYPELTETNASIVEIATLSEEERRVRFERLKKLAEEPYPQYELDAGDVLNIKVYNHPDLETQTPVTPDGHVGMMFVGQVKVGGCTLPEASKRIEQALETYIKNPVVGISPVSINSQSVTIAGGVEHPGMYSVSSGLRLSDLFAKAGGSSSRLFDGQVVDVADFKHSLFIRGDRIIDVDFAAAIEKGDYWNNIKLHRGDYIYIAVRSETMVTILGEVHNPHRRIWNRTLGLLELIADGGGLRETYWQYAVIMRGGFADPTYYRVDLDGVLQGKKPNVMLEPGDIVYIPRDNISEYNVFIRKLMPTGQLINLFLTPAFYWTRF